MNDMQHGDGTLSGGLLTILALFFNTAFLLTKEDVSFFLGVIVSLLAIAHYIISIRKNTKKDE